MSTPLFTVRPGMQLRVERTVSIEIDVPEASAPPAPAPRDLGAELRELVVALDREAAAVADPGRVARAVWHGLLEGGWMLLDSFEHDDRWFVVARERPTGARRPSLTERERQVFAFAARGHSNKFAAYELGLTPSTVATHLRRAMAKLGVATRAELMRAAPMAALAGATDANTVDELTMDR